ENAVGPFFSPNGQWIGFFANGKLKKVSLGGGAPLTLCDAPDPQGGSWGPDDTILFAPTCCTGISADSGRWRNTADLDRPKLAEGRGSPCLAGDPARRSGRALHCPRSSSSSKRHRGPITRDG